MSFAARAQVHPPEVRLVYPLGGSAGLTTRVTISGISFRNANRILFDQPGITAKIVSPDMSKQPAPTLDNDNVPVIVADFTVDRSAPRDLFSFRVISDAGVSSPGKFLVGRELPQAEEIEPNNGRAQAQSVTLPLSVNGHISDAADTDTFAFDLEAGKAFVAEVVAAQAGSPLDSLLTLQNSDGQEVASNDDFSGSDSLLTFTAKTSGRYVLTLSSSVGAGSAAHAYRLSLGYLPLLTGTLPGTLPRGKTVSVTPIGVNLPARFDVTIPADWRYGLAHIHTSEGVSSNGVIVGVSNLPLVVQEGANNDPQHAITMPAPGVANGRFFQPNSKVGSKPAFYKFHADAGKRYLMDVQCQDRSGERIDPMLSLYDTAGALLAENDDSLGRDSHLDRTFDKAGDYVLRVKNLSGGNAPDLVYQLLIQEPPAPGFSLSTETRGRGLGKGDSAAFEVQVDRDRWEGPVTLTAADLPSGITSSSEVVPAGVARGLIVLTADAGTPLTAFPLHIVGTADVNGKKITHILTRASDRIWNGGAMTLQPSPVDSLYYAVTPASEIAVRTDAKTLTVSQGGSVKVKAQFERRVPYMKPITLTAIGLPDGVTVVNVTVQPNMMEAELELKAMPNARIGAFPIALDGVVTSSPQVLLDRVSLPVLLTVEPPKPAPKAAVLKSASVPTRL